MQFQIKIKKSSIELLKQTGSLSVIVISSQHGSLKRNLLWFRFNRNSEAELLTIPSDYSSWLKGIANVHVSIFGGLLSSCQLCYWACLLYRAAAATYELADGHTVVTSQVTVAFLPVPAKVLQRARKATFSLNIKDPVVPLRYCSI